MISLLFLYKINKITIFSSEELLRQFPELTPKQRESMIARKYGAVFIIGIGARLSTGSALEISSMGICVSRESLERQLELKGCTDRKKLLFHRMLLNNELPACIGGGIGQSRLCLFLLKKTHIGEVQSSIWPDEVIEQSENNGIRLL